MSKRTYHPRSSAGPIYLAATVLGLLGLIGVIVMLVAMADVPRQAYYLLIAAFGLLIVALAGALAVLLATNTRRPWGIDPNVRPQSSAPSAGLADPYGASTEELLRHAVQLPDGNGYGRRQSDDRTVVQRLISSPEHDDHALPRNIAPRPSWATEMLPPAYREQPSEELPEQPAPPFTEIPLDHLDLMPDKPDAIDQKQDRAEAGA